MATDALRRLERLRPAFGPESGREKCELLRELQRTRLRSARALERLHEQLCFMRASEDGVRVRLWDDPAKQAGAGTPPLSHDIALAARVAAR